ncbi:MAG: hypothetical protein AABZ60_11315 [Planctomycetota bacterium]
MKTISFLLVFSLMNFFYAQEGDVETLNQLKATKVTLDFAETPLPQVLSFFSEVCAIEIVEDGTSLTAQDADEILLNLSVSDMALWNVLKLISSLHDLSLKVEPKKVLIGRKKTLGDLDIKTEFIDVTDLLKASKITPRVLSYLIQEETDFESWADPKTYLKHFEFLIEESDKSLPSASLHHKLLVSQTPGLLKQTYALLEVFKAKVQAGIPLTVPPAIALLDSKMEQQKVTFAFPGIPVEEILNFLQNIAELNIVRSPAVSELIKGKTISFSAEDISLRKALTQILEQTSASLGYSYQEESITIEKKEFQNLQTKENKEKTK